MGSSSQDSKRQSKPMKKRYVLIDRDGTVNVEKHYLSDPDDLKLETGVATGMRRMMEMGLGLVIVTNQSGVARGYFNEARVKEINDRLLQMLKAEGIEVDGVYYCPHATDEGCDCRKPNPGMALQAARDLDFNLAQAFMIGDKPADIDMGRAIGAKTFLVRTGYGAEHEGKVEVDYVVDGLDQAADIIEANIKRAQSHK